MTSLAQKLGLACKDAREHAGLNQTELAALHEDVQQSHISRMEKGVVLPSLMSMLRIEKLCGLPPGWILNRAGVISLATPQPRWRLTSTNALMGVAGASCVPRWLNWSSKKSRPIPKV